jgi:hypothetical protein
MKTSTKLLLIFFLPVSRFRYGHTTRCTKKTTGRTHTYVMELRPDPTQAYTEIKLQPFKYLVDRWRANLWREKAKKTPAGGRQYAWAITW